MYPYLKLERESCKCTDAQCFKQQADWPNIWGSGKGCQASHEVGHTAQSVGQTGMQWNSQSCSMTDCQAVGQTDKKWDRQSASEIVRHAVEQTYVHCDRKACNDRPSCNRTDNQAL